MSCFENRLFLWKLKLNNLVKFRAYFTMEDVLSIGLAQPVQDNIFIYAMKIHDKNSPGFQVELFHRKVDVMNFMKELQTVLKNFKSVKFEKEFDAIRKCGCHRFEIATGMEYRFYVVGEDVIETIRSLFSALTKNSP